MLVLIVAAETVSFVTLWVRGGRLPTWSALHTERQEILERTRPGPTGPGPGAGSQRYAIHPFVGYVADPTVVPTTHALGFDGSTDPVQTRGSDTTIVAILGAEAAATFVRVGMPSVRKRCASEHVEGLVVVNLAREGYKQPQPLMALSYILALGGAFDVVVNIDGWEDITSHATRNAAKGVHPAFPRDWYLLTSQVPDRQLRRLLGRRAYLASQTAALATDMANSPLRYSMTATLLWNLRQAGLAHHLAETVGSIRDHRTRAGEHVPYRTRGPRVELAGRQVDELLIDLWARGSMLIDGLCRQNKTRYMHFLEPRLNEGAEATCERLREAGQQLVEEGVDFADLSGHPAGDPFDLVVDRVADAIIALRRPRSK